MKHLLFFLSCLALFSACGKGAQKHQGTTYTTEEKVIINQCLQQNKIPEKDKAGKLLPCRNECLEFKASIPGDWFQETIDVPEDPSNPDGKTIKVFYYGKLFPNSVPVVFFNGGPAASSHSSYQTFTPEVLSMLDPGQKISLIYIDQRGNGCSEYYPQGNSEEILERLRFYGSSGIVADAEIIRKKILGDKKWIAFGQSYGGFIAHRYLAQHPESLLAISSHANVITDDPFLRLKYRVLSEQRVLKNYFSEYPQDESKVKVISARFTKDECVYQNSRDPKSDKYCGYSMIYDFASFMAFHPNWKGIHKYLGLMVDESGFVNWDYVSRYVSYFFSLSESSKDSSYSTYYLDKVLLWTDRNMESMTLGNCQKARQEILAETSEDIGQNPFSECSIVLQKNFDGGDALAPFRHLKRDILTVGEFAKTVKANPLVSVFLYSGELDQTVPKEDFMDEVSALSQLPHFHYTHFLHSGHDGFFTEKQVWDDLGSQLLLTNLADSP